MADDLEPGWLERQITRLPSDIAYAWSPTTVWENGMTSIRAPLDPVDAVRLRERMMKRYHEWTGRSLEADLAKDRRS